MVFRPLNPFPQGETQSERMPCAFRIYNIFRSAIPSHSPRLLHLFTVTPTKNSKFIPGIGRESTDR